MGLLARIDEVRVYVALGLRREGTHAEHAVFRLQGEVNAFGNVVGHECGHADAEVDVIAVFQLFGGADTHFIAGPGHIYFPLGFFLGGAELNPLLEMFALENALARRCRGVDHVGVQLGQGFDQLFHLSATVILPAVAIGTLKLRPVLL